MKLRTRDLTLVSLFVALTAIGAFVKIPLPTVPISLQTLFVLLSGFVLGSRLATISQVVYILLGLAGLPIFTKGGGLGYVFQPSFGYLVGFVPAAYLIGWLVERGGRGPNGIGKWKNVRILETFLIVMVGTIMVYVIGVPYLYWILNFVAGKSMGLGTVLKVGFLVFLPGDILKAVVVAVVAERLGQARVRGKAMIG